MKNYFKISAALFMFAGFVSCTSDEIVGQQQTDNFTVDAIMEAVESRTNPEAYVDNNGKTKYHTNWHSEDAIYVYGYKVKGILTLQEGAGTTDGKFTGRVYGDSRKLQYSAYPAELIEVDADGFVTGFNLTEIDFKNTMAPMFGEFSNPNTVNFQHLTGMVRVRIDNVPANSTFELKGIGISGKASLVNNGDGTYSLEPEIKDQITSIKVTNIPEGNQTLYIPVFIANPDANGIEERYLSLNLNGENLVGNSPCVNTMVGNVTVKNMPDLVWNENAPAKSKLTRISTLDENTQPEEVVENTDPTKDYDYLIASAEELLWFANEVNTGNNSFEGKIVKLGASIDLNGQKWNPIDGGKSNVFKGTFDGDNFMISNLKVATEGTASAGLFAQTRGTIKNLYIENVDIKGHYKAGAIVGDGLCSKIENCHVNGGTITVTPYEKNDANNVGGIVGYLSAEPTAYVKDCSVDGLTITAYRKVAGIVGAATGHNGTPEVSNNTVTNTVVIADQTSEYNEVKAPDTGKIVGWNGMNIDLSSNTDTNVTIEVKINDADGLVAALENGEDVTFSSNIKIEKANLSNAYGKTGITILKGQTIDGKDYILDVRNAKGTWDSCINTTGGLIKNLTVTSGFRGIFINHNSQYSDKVVLENVTIDGTVYTISCDQGLNQGLEAYNCTINGWTSYDETLGDAMFVDCKFGEGSGYAFCRPYAPTTFTDCEFEKGFTLDARATCTFINCKLDGVLLTEENIATLVTSNKLNAVINNN